jgi:hypothetical protein
MSYRLEKGQRVRVTGRNRVGYRPGDRGTVLRVSSSAATGQRYYIVAMDADDSSGTAVLFTEDEVEPEGVGGAGAPTGPAAAKSNSGTVMEIYP